MKLPSQCFGYDYWIYSQLEPTDILIAGNYKTHKPMFMVKREMTEQIKEIEKRYPPFPKMTEEERDAWNEEMEKKLGL